MFQLVIARRFFVFSINFHFRAFSIRNPNSGKLLGLYPYKLSGGFGASTLPAADRPFYPLPSICPACVWLFRLDNCLKNGVSRQSTFPCAFSRHRLAKPVRFAASSGFDNPSLDDDWGIFLVVLKKCGFHPTYSFPITKP